MPDIEFIARDRSALNVVNKRTVNVMMGAVAPPRRGVGFVLSATSETYSVLIDEKNLLDDMIEAQPWRGANGSPMGWLNAIASAGSVAVEVKAPPGTVFAKGDPILIAESHEVADGYEDGSKEWRLITTAASVSTATYEGIIWTLGVAALTNDYFANALVISPINNRMTSMGVGKDRYRMVGLRKQTELMAAPTITLGGTSTSSTILLVVTVPTSKAGAINAQYARVYLFDNPVDAMRLPKPNQQPDGIESLNGTTFANFVLSTYRGGTDYGGGDVSSGNKYYAVAYLTDAGGDWPEISSDPSAVFVCQTL